MLGLGFKTRVFGIATVALFFGVPGLLLCGYAARQAWMGYSASGWPTIEATVQRPSHEVLDLRFAYEADKFPFQSDLVRYNQSVSSLASWEMAVLAMRHPPGSKVRLHYYPRDPAIAVLEPGVSLIVLLPVCIGAILLLLTAGSIRIMLDTLGAMSAGTLLFAAVFCCTGLALLVPFGTAWLHANASREWPVVEGRVMLTTATPHYEFQVDGKSYAGVRHHWPPPDSAHDTWDADLRNFQDGQAVRVRYNRQDPWDSVIEPGAHEDNMVLLGAGAAVLLFGIAAGFAGARTNKRL